MPRKKLILGLLACCIAVWHPAATFAADKKGPAPTFENVSYGPHQRNVLDFWKAESPAPTPVVVFIHEGSFTEGDKTWIRGHAEIPKCLDAGVSFASINYRFRMHASIQDILRDSARAIQFLRSQADVWNIDPRRIASYGVSAGAGTSVWLAAHDDLADPKAGDPVLRQSTRLSAAGSIDGQASYDLREWDALMGVSPFSMFGTFAHRFFYRFDTPADAQSEKADKIMRDCSMIGLLSPDDPPIACACSFPLGRVTSGPHYIHHPKHSVALADRCKQHGVECLLLLRDRPDYSRSGQHAAVVDFLLEKLQSEKP